MMDKFSLEGKTALVTGCKRGIGKAMAIGLAEAGADIIGVSATLEESGSKIEKEIVAIGRSFKGYTCDFSDRNALYNFIKRVKNDFSIILSSLSLSKGFSLFFSSRFSIRSESYWKLSVFVPSQRQVPCRAGSMVTGTACAW